MVPCKSTAEEVSVEWSHHRISSPDSKVQLELPAHTCYTTIVFLHRELMLDVKGLSIKFNLKYFSNFIRFYINFSLFIFSF